MSKIPISIVELHTIYPYFVSHIYIMYILVAINIGKHNTIIDNHTHVLHVCGMVENQYEREYVIFRLYSYSGSVAFNAIMKIHIYRYMRQI